MTLSQEDLDKITLVARYSTQHTSVYSMDQEFIKELIRVGKLHGFECGIHRSYGMNVGVIIRYTYFNLLGSK